MFIFFPSYIRRNNNRKQLSLLREKSSQYKVIVSYTHTKITTTLFPLVYTHTLFSRPPALGR